MSDKIYHAMLAKRDEMGYDTSRFRRVPQRPGQIGTPAFWSPGNKN